MFDLRVLAICCTQLLALHCLSALPVEGAPNRAVSPIRPLQAELIAPLDISQVHVGSTVLIRVDLEWAGSGCMLRTASILQGHIVAMTKRSKGVKDSELQLTFDTTDCIAHREKSFPFRLVAIVGTDGSLPSTGQSGVVEAPPLADAIGNTIGGAGGGFRSALSASEINSTSSLPLRHLPAQILPGQVLDVKKTALLVGAGQQGASIIRGIGHGVRLEPGTILIFTHEAIDADMGPKATTSRPGGFGISGTSSGTSKSAATSVPGQEQTAAPAVSANVPPPPEPLDETSICTGSCNVVGASESAASLQNSAAKASISLTRLGYAPRNNREIVSFDKDTVLTYLDAHNLLCTFDPHQLWERTGPGWDAVRKIRAVLVDPETYSIKQIMEWRVQGDEQYMWRLADGKILVHMGREIREFDTQLEPLHSIPVDSKVAWVVASPDGDHIAVGTVRERHSQAEHRDLEAALPYPPEEDIEVRVFDKDMAVILTIIQSSRLPQPVLSDSGELRLHDDGHTHWKISEYRWDRTEHKIATTTSTCRPALSTPGQGLIFAVGCASSGGIWYRMLRVDGHPVLKGESASNEIQQYAQGTEGGDFAVRTVTAVRAMNLGEPFKRDDLVKENIRIYRSRNGAHLASIITADFVTSQLAFALSPNGDQLAVMGNSSILFYPVRPH